jgi:hypothetical protein
MFIGRSASPHASAFSPLSSGLKTLSYFLDEGCRDDVDANFFRFLYACGIPSMFFAHHIGMKCYKSSMVPLKDTRVSSMTKLEPWDLTGKEPKSKAL